MFEWLWAAFTVTASAAQTVRNGVQRSLTKRLGTVGATHVRFLYGLPFSFLFLLIVCLAMGAAPPAPNLAFLLWVALGAFAQILATGLMLSAMNEKSFVVTTALTKTEPIHVALFAVVVLGEHLSALALMAIVIATGGVLMMSWPAGTETRGFRAHARPALRGIASGALFGAAAVGFRGGVLTLEHTSFVLRATTTLVWGLAFQAFSLSSYLAVRERQVLVGVLKAWRASLPAGFTGALASQFWFLAFALEQVARVRTLALVEVIFAWALSRKVFRQGTTGLEAAGLLLVVLGVGLILNS